MLQKHFQKYEKLLFKVVVLLSALPLLVFEFYPTMDGAAHLYNSNLVWSLLFQDFDVIHQFYEMNAELVPNWTGHFLLSVLNSFLPAHIADTTVLLFCVVGLPLAFRKLLHTINPDSVMLSYLIFPFVYSFTFTLGFYNFSIALVCLFFTLSYWLQVKDKPFSLKTILALFLLITVTYFSHLFVFAILLLTLGLKVIHDLVYQLVADKTEFKKSITKSFYEVMTLLSASFITLFLFAQYFLNRPSLNDSSWISREELIDDLMIVDPIISYNADIEGPWSQWLFYILLVALAGWIFVGVNAIRKAFNDQSSKPKKYILRGAVKHSFWPLMVVVLLILYFTLPNSDGYAGYISTRVALLFFMFLILWLATAKFNKWFLVIVAAGSIFITFKFTAYNSGAVKHLNDIAINCVTASQKIPENSVVLPINVSDHWLLPHFSNYLGAEKPLVILENYEASTGYFPVRWDEDSVPTTLLGNSTTDEFECLNWKSGKASPAVSVDYVFLMGTLNAKDQCHKKIQSILDASYGVVYENGRVSLYEKK